MLLKLGIDVSRNADVDKAVNVEESNDNKDYIDLENCWQLYLCYSWVVHSFTFIRYAYSKCDKNTIV